MYNRQLDTFIRVADMGSFGKAAESLYISPPAVIQQINILENHFGFKLFERSSRGVKLTLPGRSVYEDAKAIIHLSEESLKKARRLVDRSETTVRIGTSVLFKCRLLPDLWTKVSERYPDLKIEIIPIPDKQELEDSINDFGAAYDIREGVYSSPMLKNKIDSLRLMDTPFCCAVSKEHRLAGYERITMQDLNGEYIVMPIRGVSDELDSFRDEICSKYPTIKIVDSPYYGVDTFTLCELNQYVLITQLVYTDIHSNLITIPLETDYTLPYGLMFSKNPTPAAKKFIDEVKKLQNERKTM